MSDYQKGVDLCTTNPGIEAMAAADAAYAKLRGQSRIAKTLTCRHSFAG